MAVLVVVISLVVGGCGAHLNQVRTAFYDQRAQDALAVLDQQESTGKRDRLLYLLARGTILNHLERYPDSTTAFLAAADFIAAHDYIRVSEQTASIATNEWATTYKGEYAERLWIHTYLMMNFLLMDRPESALVEARRALKVYEAHEAILSGELFSRALIALCFDVLGESNDAYIEYKRVADGLGDAAPVARELARLANLLWEPDQAEMYRGEIPELLAQWPADRSAVDLIVFMSWGRGPVKRPRNFVVPPGIRFSFPVYRKNPIPAGAVTVIVDGEPAPVSLVGLDVGRVAAASLEARRAQVLVKEAARVAAKEALVQSLERDDDAALAGALLRAAFVVLEEADTRSWQTLPATIQLLRVPIPAGRSNVAVQMDIGSHAQRIDLGEIQSQGRSHVFRSIRILD